MKKNMDTTDNTPEPTQELAAVLDGTACTGTWATPGEVFALAADQLPANTNNLVLSVDGCAYIATLASTDNGVATLHTTHF